MATDREEAVRGLHCVSAPVLSASGPVVAVSNAFSAALGSAQASTGMLRRAANRISRCPGVPGHAHLSNELTDIG